MSGIRDEWTTEDGSIRLLLGDCLEILPGLGKVDAVVTDPPYSARTHAGHDASSKGHCGQGNDGALRKALGYEPWDESIVAEFAAVAGAACHGWLVCMTDHVLAPAWCSSMEAAGRYVFAPLPYFAPGSRVRLSGDGPSSWTTWIVVSRTKQQSRWGTLPGGYVRDATFGPHAHMGGKPAGLMVALVEDYSRKNDLVCDPCLGSGTTGVACIRLGRRFIGIEKEPKYFEIAKRRIRDELDKTRLIEKPKRLVQASFLEPAACGQS